MCTSHLAQWVTEIFCAFTKPLALQELMHILQKRANLKSKTTWKCSRGKEAAKKERRKSCLLPKGMFSSRFLLPAKGTDRIFKLLPLFHLSFHWPPHYQRGGRGALPLSLNTVIFWTIISQMSFLILQPDAHGDGVLHFFMLLEQWHLLLLSNYLFLLSCILQALNGITFTK